MLGKDTFLASQALGSLQNVVLIVNRHLLISLVLVLVRVQIFLEELLIVSLGKEMITSEFAIVFLVN